MKRKDFARTLIISIMGIFIATILIIIFLTSLNPHGKYCPYKTIPCSSGDLINIDSEAEKALLICRNNVPCSSEIVSYIQSCDSTSYDYVCGCYPTPVGFINKDFKYVIESPCKKDTAFKLL